MKNTIKIIAFFVPLLFLNCQKTTETISDNKDYYQFLDTSNTELKLKEERELAFWSEKINAAPNQHPYLGKMAAIKSNLFEVTGEISYLKSAEKSLRSANKMTAFNNASYLRSLARNYISQHKFTEAYALLKKAEWNGEKLVETQKMLFDVHLELGMDKEADYYLSQFKNFNDFDYLIRLSKWNDYKGDLAAAIETMEKATRKAEELKNNNLLQWSYTNLADFYGHNNEVKKSYNLYLKALEIEPTNSYAKKGIAWILYSYENRPKEALRVLDSIKKEHTSPDYYLLQAEIAEYVGDKKLQQQALIEYKALVSNKEYGSMYNKYNVSVYLEDENTVHQAFIIANEEVANRPTPQSYDLLAWCYYHKGDVKKSLEIIQNHVEGKTFEPEILYHIAEIYKANNIVDNIKGIKKELLASSYELGPLMEEKIKLL